jgi:hypothetical protein
MEWLYGVLVVGGFAALIAFVGYELYHAEPDPNDDDWPRGC